MSMKLDCRSAHDCVMLSFRPECNSSWCCSLVWPFSLAFGRVVPSGKVAVCNIETARNKHTAYACKYPYTLTHPHGFQLRTYTSTNPSHTLLFQSVARCNADAFVDQTAKPIDVLPTLPHTLISRQDSFMPVVGVAPAKAVMRRSSAPVQ